MADNSHRSVGPTMFCMAATPFTASGAIDEHALRELLQRMVDANVGVYLGGGGAGEAHAMTREEIADVYRIGVDVCGGRVPTYANPPECRTAEAMHALVMDAVAAGVDIVQIYPVDGGHGMIPTLAEQEAYYRDILDQVDHPTALSVHHGAGYITSLPLIKSLCQSYPHVQAVNVFGPSAAYFAELRDAVGPSVALYGGIRELLQYLALGVAGCMAAEPNLVPRTSRAVIDQWIDGDVDAAAATMHFLLRLHAIVSRWSPSTARWVKMGLHVLGLPGGNGVLRKPYLLPPQEDLDQMAREFEAIGLAEREGL